MSNLFIFGLCAHLFADWFLQNEWQAQNKASLKHPAAYVHSGIHTALLLLVFPALVAVAVGITHLLIDTRKPLQWWRKVTRQTQVQWRDHYESKSGTVEEMESFLASNPSWHYAGYSIGDSMNVMRQVKEPINRESFMRNVAAVQVAFWQDQVAHILVIALAAWLVTR